MPHFQPSDILLPDFAAVNGTRYAVIACDQFTSEPDFWEETERLVGDSPSTLRAVLPELFLGERTSRIPAIHKTMHEYAKHLLLPHPGSMICVRRVTSSGEVRLGLIGQIDLSDYDYRPGTAAPIRATEGTVADRIPPRLEVRRGAPLEFPHVMLLLDDPAKTVIEPCAARLADPVTGCTPLYDFPLLQGGGRVTGWLLPKEILQSTLQSLDRYEAGKSGFLYAVGDGNHSLASAKAYYDELCASLGQEAAMRHPARYALTELVNLHDPSLAFRPIYRAVFGAEEADLLRELTAFADSAASSPENIKNPRQTITWLAGDRSGEIVFAHGAHSLTVGSLTRFLDGYLARHPGVTVDYIHGEDSLHALAKKPGTLAFLFSGMQKEELFPSVESDGALPRKTFSMGEARDKR